MRPTPALFLLLTVLSWPAWGVQEYGFKVLEKKPQTRDTFVQGL